MDRLAKNLAGAFVKSLLPDLESSSKATPAAQDFRRAPASYEQRSLILNPNYYPAQYQFPNPYGPPPPGMYSPIVPPISPQMTQIYPNTGLAYYQSPISSVYPATNTPYSVRPPNPFSAIGDSQMSQNGMPFGAEYQPVKVNGLNKVLGPLAAGNGDIDSLNKARNEQYYADLQKHQQDLMQYGEKQMEFLNQQRRYQQAVLDQRAGAALMMQKQQQDVMKKRRNALRRLKKLEKQSTFKQSQLSRDASTMEGSNPEASYEPNLETRYDQQTGGHVLLAAKKLDPAKQFAARDELERHFANSDGVEDVVSDEKLKEFFKEHYGIDVKENGAELTEKERNTLRGLKHHLSSEAYEKAISNGIFKTMADFKNTMTNSNTDRSKDYDSEGEFPVCDKCIPINIGKLRGAWTQIYGNPSVLRKTYSTILSLRKASLKSGKITTTNLTKRKASCVGLQFGEAAYQATSMRLFFRDDSRLHELYEMSGTLKSDGAIMGWDLSGLNIKMCVVEVGPPKARAYDYMVLTETDGTNSCMSYHIYARSSEQFHRKYYDNIANFMKSEVVHGTALPVAGIPKPSLCEINDDDQ